MACWRKREHGQAGTSSHPSGRAGTRQGRGSPSAGGKKKPLRMEDLVPNIPPSPGQQPGGCHSLAGEYFGCFFPPFFGPLLTRALGWKRGAVLAPITYPRLLMGRVLMEDLRMFFCNKGNPKWFIGVLKTPFAGQNYLSSKCYSY